MFVKRMTYLASIVIAFGALLTLAVQHSLAAPLAAPTNEPVSVCTWLGCKPGALSYTQDDASNVFGEFSCRPHLEAAGFRGTFFFDGTSVTTTWMADYVAAGHEIGAHLASHLANSYAPACHPNCTLMGLRQTPTTTEAIASFRSDQIDPSVSLIESETGRPVVSMAYPFGAADANRMTAAELYFLGARGYFNPDFANFPWITGVNAATPPDAMLISSDDLSWQTLIQTAINENKWAVLTMHDYCFGIGEDGNYLANNADSLWVAPMGEVMKYINVRNNARFGNYVQTYNSISFEAGHSLNTMARQTYTGTALLPIVFDNPVTLVADLPVNNGVGSVTVDGTPVTFAITGSITGTHSVYFTTSLGITRSVAIQLTGPTSVQLRDLRVRSDTDLGENLGWLFAMIVLGASGLAGLLKVSRQHPRHPAVHDRPRLSAVSRQRSS